MDAGRPRPRRWLRLAAVAVVVAALGVATLLRDPRPRFAERRSALAAAREAPSVQDRMYVFTPVRVEATSGLAVDLVVRRHVADSGARLPLAVILGGHHTGQDAARLLGPTPGILVAALSYPFTGDPRPDAITFLRDIPRIRAAFFDTPPAVMLALDYLLKRSDVDTMRVEGLGVSLGAPFICMAGALDQRLTRVWAVHGSGGSYAPLEASMRRTIKFAPARKLAAAVASLLIAGPRLDPVKWVDEIAPRPFMMVNAEGDERLPRPSVDALFAAAREPKEMIWMPGGHIHADSATIAAVLQIVLDRMK